eukprot:COSAG01_NODE_1183_length_11346_cov_263.800302_6_plen_125_part_00
MHRCTGGCERHSSSRTADLQLATVIRSSKSDLLSYRTGELAQPAQQPAHQNLLAPTGSQQGTGSYVRTYGTTARIPSLEVDPPATVQVATTSSTARKNTPFTNSGFRKNIGYRIVTLKGIVSKY